jgi:predicted transcriptional regulator
MVYLEIPYIAENNRVNRTTAQNEIQILKISNEAKADVFEAIFNRRPNGVSFEDKEIDQVLLLEKVLGKLGIPYRQVKEQ